MVGERFAIVVALFSHFCRLVRWWRRVVREQRRFVRPKPRLKGGRQFDVRVAREKGRSARPSGHWRRSRTV
jgi:hypothetical protein